MSDLIDRVNNLLVSLGETSDDVAEALRSRGITGVREDGCECPIAHLIQAEIPEALDEMWGDDSVSWYVTGSLISTPHGGFIPPQPVVRFIEVFDATNAPGPGEYADLEASEEVDE